VLPRGHCDSDGITALAVASDGAIYIAGYERMTQYNPRTPQHWLRRLEPDYTQTWVRTFDYPEFELRAMRASVTGGVLIAGATLEGAAESPWIAAYDSTGERRWQTILPVAGHVNGLATGLAGEAVVVGTAAVGDASDLWVAKLDTRGVEQWSARLGDERHDAGVAAAVDAQGRTWVVGGSSELSLREPGGYTYDTYALWYPSPGWSFERTTLALLDSAGEPLWTRDLGPAGAFAVATLPGGDAVVGGRDGVESLSYSAAPWLARFDPSGAEVWRAQLGTWHVREIAVDREGDIYALDGDLLYRFDSDGELQGAPSDVWQPFRQFAATPSDALALDASDRPIIGGQFIVGSFTPRTG
jgi:hypothetical protein